MNNKEEHDLSIANSIEMGENIQETVSLFFGKQFSSWEACETFIYEWAKGQGFRIVKIALFEKMEYYVDANNPKSLITVNKFLNEHNHTLNHNMIEFEDAKKFTYPMMEDIRFMTIDCKFGATIQRKFLEGKYPLQPIHSKDLYDTAIQKFRPTNKSLSNDAAKISNWLDQQKEIDLRWIIARGWDDDNALTHLFWMSLSQIENWIEYSDCVVNNVTHKTNRYGMALSLFVGFDNNRYNILLAQVPSSK
ncbi:unnamed protein product [Rhizophagus irregularis]|nr:unnamed protein product [Rhizophagus irregularis]